jgi:tetratricopeptide (TPR) repeat protein
MSAACKPLSWLLLMTAVPLSAQLSGCALNSSGTPPSVTKPVAPMTAATTTPTPADVADTSAGATASTVDVPKIMVAADVQKRFDDAVALLGANRVSEAQQQFLRLTQTNPELSAPWINLGAIELKASHFDTAIDYFKKALQHDAQSAVANNYLGMSYRNQGKFSQAEAAYQAAIAANKDYALAHFNLGLLYDLYLQKPEQAIEQYESYQALQGTPDAKVAAWIKDLKARLVAKTKAEKES